MSSFVSAYEISNNNTDKPLEKIINEIELNDYKVL